MKMKKILMVAPEGLGQGGVQKLIMDYLEHNKNVTVDIVLFTSEKRHYDEKFVSYGGRIFRFRESSLPKFRFLQRADYYLRGYKIYLFMKKILKENSYDSVYCHNSFESGICLKVAKQSGIKNRVSHHHVVYTKGNFIRNRLNRFYSKLICKNSTSVIFCSDMALNSFKSIYRKPFKNVKVIYNGINLEKFTYVPRISLKNDSIIKIIHVGQYSKNKNQELILRLVAELKLLNKQVHLTLVGFGNEYKSYLLSLSEKLNICNEVTYIDNVSEVSQYLQKNDFFIFPSKREGFGLALIEAQASGLKCFASKTISNKLDLGMVSFFDINSSIENITKQFLALVDNDDLLLDKQKLNKYSFKNYNYLINNQLFKF